MNERLNVNNKKDEMILYRSSILLIGLIFLSIVIGLITYLNIEHVSDNLKLFSTLVIFFCILVSLWSFSKFFFKKPVLIINSEIFYSPKTGQLVWSDIEKIGMRSINTGALIGFSFYRIPRVYFYLKNGKIIGLDTRLYNVDPIEIIRILCQHHKIVHLEDGSEFIFS